MDDNVFDYAEELANMFYFELVQNPNISTDILLIIDEVIKQDLQVIMNKIQHYAKVSDNNKYK